MDLLPSAEQLEIVSAAREFLAERVPVEQIRADRDKPSAIRAEVWREGTEMGLLTLGLPIEFGGSGSGFDDEVLLHTELGRSLAPGAFLAGTLGARVAALCGDGELAHDIGSGESSVALAVLRGDGEARNVKGTFDLFDSSGARYALLVARSGAALVDIVEFGERVAVASADPGVRVASATVESAKPLHWVSADTEWMWGRAVLLTAAYLTGIALAAAEAATEHAKHRVQFGKPIGANQAIKHRCVDMAVAAEAAQAQTYFAAIALDIKRGDAL
ncbi:MAG: hypothetical protein QOE41_4389, partial [Mycobacterium sp.]|nr:hypothetical protein [Mycobacterium sp.]